MRSLYPRKNTYFIAMVFMLAVLAACHKTITGPAPAPSPVDTTHYLTTEESSYYFHRIKGTRYWDGTDHVDNPTSGNSYYSFTDSLITIDYGDTDTSRLSIKIGTQAMYKDSLKAKWVNNAIVFYTHYSGFEDEYQQITYFADLDSITYSDNWSVGHGSGSHNWHTR